MNLIHMKQNGIKELKKKLWEEQKGICPLLGIEVDFDDTVLDHIHATKKDTLSKEKGAIRNFLERRANALEGKFFNFWKRSYGADESKWPCSPSTFLRNLADYLEVGAYEDEDGNVYIHPSEVPKPKKLNKNKFNKISKLYSKDNPLKKPLEYPKSGQPTKLILGLSEKYGIEL